MKRIPDPPGKLRIIAGSLKNSKLPIPELPGLRPTSDRVRETLFNWLAPVIEGARCLDVFAGTGALGIEALSRGASDVDFLERDSRLASLLRENLTRLRQRADVRVADALAALAEAPARSYDIVFLDPPFTVDLWESAALALESNGWLAANAFVYVESPADRTLSLPPTWTLHRQGKAGAVRYALYRRSAKL
jgi:16S rRNA (guanine966-N2)-methyltransferase